MSLRDYWQLRGEPDRAPTVDEDTEAAYRRLVAEDQPMCEATPVEWSGRLRNGRAFYFRYRWGSAQLGLGDSLDEAIDNSRPGAGVVEQVGGEFHGYLDDVEYRALFVRLIQRHADPDTAKATP